jgi:hypothetical protein
MAYKTESEVVALFKAMLVLRLNTRATLSSFLVNDVNNIKTALDPGDETDEDSASEQALSDLLAQADQFFDQVDTVVGTIIPHIGRLVGASDINNFDIVLSAWNDYLHANAKSVKTQDFVKFSSMSAGGSNVGTGKVTVLNTDGQSLDMNISHVETLTFKCIQDSTQGAVAGREVFSISGAQSTNRRAWERGGSGPSGQYVGGYGAGVKEWPPSVQQARGNATNTDSGNFTCCGASVASGNLISNGDFEIPISGSGNSKLANWTFTSGEATTVQASTAGTDLINGSYCLKATAMFSMYQKDLTNKLKQGVPLGLSIKCRPINGGSGTVTFTGHVKVMSTDDVTTYATHTFTDADFTVNLNGQSSPTVFVLPVGAKPCKVVVDLTAIGGSAATPTVAFDDVIVGEAPIVDGGRAVAIHDGSNVNDAGMLVGRFRFNDLFTGATAAPTVQSEAQRFVNERFSRYVKHNSSPVTFVEPTLEPEIAVEVGGSNLADGGTDALGTVSVSLQVRTYTIRNTGNSPLAINLPVAAPGSQTNCTASIATQPAKSVLLPLETTTLVVNVTPSGAGAFSCTVSFENNDSDEDPFNWTISGTAA